VQQQLSDRIQQLIRQNATDMAAAVYHLPTTVFTDPEYHLRECRRLFGERPQAVAFASEIARPGDFVTVMLGKIPLLLVRDEQSRVNALVNICRHRGARVVNSESGHAKRFSCPFHAWCYGLDGALTAIPGEAVFAGIDPGEYGLITLASEQRHGLIWVQPQPQRSLAMAAYLSPPLDDELNSYRLEEFTLFRAKRYSVAANWKLSMDGFMESYHIRSLHRDTVGPHFYSNINTVDQFGEHLRLLLAKKRIDRMFELPRADWGLLCYTTIVYVLFPGTIMVWQAGHLEVFLIRPDSVDPGRCHIHFGLLIPQQRSGETELWERNWQRVIETVPAEDLPQAEQIQAGFSAGLQNELLIGRNELGMQCFYKAVQEALAA
jgi:phenylpropionate dioxygenase-like ring-hydroxylating dioxygenase large terminal subunit